MNKMIFTARKRSCGQGNIFIGVCQEFCSGGVSASVHAGIHTPPRSRACWEIQSMRGQYASYWNAILFYLGLGLGCVCVGVCKISLSFRFRISLSDMTNYKLAFGKVCRIKNRQTFKSMPILNSAYHAVKYAELRIGILLKVCRFVIRHITTWYGMPN